MEKKIMLDRPMLEILKENLERNKGLVIEETDEIGLPDKMADEKIEALIKRKSSKNGKRYYNNNQIKTLEELCYQQLDAWNHQGIYADEDGYVWFMFRGKKVVDPWQKETYQVFECDWPDHEDGEMGVGNPYEYYGAEILNPFFDELCKKRGIKL